MLMRLSAAFIVGLLLLSIPGPALGSLDCGGTPAPGAAPEAVAHSTPEGCAGGRASSLNYWSQYTYGDFSAGSARDVTIANRSGAQITLGSISVHSPSFPGANITAMTRGPGDFVMAGTSKGDIIRINSTTGEMRNCGPAVAGEQSVTALAAGTDGSVWGGTAPSGKLFRVDPDDFTIASMGPAVAGETCVTALAAASDGNIWGGTGPGGRIFRVEPGTGAITPFGGAVGGETAVTAIAPVPGGRLWGGTAPTGQLFVFDTATGGFTLKGRIAPGATAVRAMVWTVRSELWAGIACGPSEGRLVLVNLTASPAPEWSVAPVACETAVNCLAEDSLGMLWGGTGAGSRLFRFDPAAKAVEGVWNLFGGGREIASICTARSGAVWGGTDGTGKLVAVSPDRVPAVPELTLSRSRSGRLFYDDFEVLRNGRPAEWTEQNSVGGSWAVAPEEGRGNVYVQQDGSAQNTFSLAGDPNWTDCYFDSMVEITDWVAADPSGNGARLAIRSDLASNRYATCAFDPQARVEFWKLGASASRVASYPLDVPHAAWTWSRVHMAGQTVDIWFNGTRVTPALGLQTTGSYARGCIALGAVRAVVRFDDASVFRDVAVTVGNLIAGQKVVLLDPAGSPLAQATAVGSSVSLDLSAQHFPLRGYFNVTWTDGKTVRYTSELVPDIWGGDAFTVNLTAPSRVYLPAGTFTSAPFDAGYGAPWANLSWQAGLPAATSLSFRVRTNATLAGLVAASWSPSMDTPGIAIPGGPSRWIQYRAELCTTVEQSTPVLRSVNISYEVLAPDVTLELNLSSPEALPGSEVNITIGLDNVGQGLASEAAVNCSLPAGLAFLNSSAEMNRRGDVWTFQNLAPGQNIDVSISAMVNASLQDGDELAVSAVVIARDSLGNAFPQPPAGAVLDIVAPVMSISLSPELPYVVPGGLLNITVSLWNAGHAGPCNITIDLQAPFSGQLANWTGPLYTEDGVRYVVNQQTPDGDLNATFSFRIAALPLGLELETRATVQYQDALGRPLGPAEGSCIVAVRNGRPDIAELNITGEASAGLVTPGSRQWVRFLVENRGSNASRSGEMSVRLSDMLAPAAGVPLKYDYSDLRPNRSVSLNISVIVNGSADDGQELAVLVDINFTDADGKPLGRWNATVKMTVTAPKASVRKTAMDPNPAPGEEVDFSIEISNNGSAPDPEVRLLERPPAGMAYVRSSTAQQGDLSWRFTDVRPGATISFFVTFVVNDTVAVGTNLTNKVLSNDTYGRNGTGEATVRVSPPQVTDISPPAVLLFTPANGRKDVPAATDIEVLFSEPMNRGSAESAFSLSPRVAGRFLWDGNKMIFRPGSPLAQGAQYAVRVSTVASDVAGNQLPANLTFSFSTKGMAPDLASAAFALALAMMAIVVAETVYLIDRRHKMLGPMEAGTPPKAEAADQQAQAVPAMEPAPPVPPSEPAEKEENATSSGRSIAAGEQAAVWEPEEGPAAPAPPIQDTAVVLGMPVPEPRARPEGISLWQPPPAPKRPEAKPPPKEENIDDILQRAMDALK